MLTTAFPIQTTYLWPQTIEQTIELIVRLKVYVAENFHGMEAHKILTFWSHNSSFAAGDLIIR